MYADALTLNPTSSLDSVPFTFFVARINFPVLPAEGFVPLLFVVLETTDSAFWSVSTLKLLFVAGPLRRHKLKFYLKGSSLGRLTSCRLLVTLETHKN